MAFDRQIVVLHVIEPLDDILAPIGARYPRCVAYAQMHAPSSQMQVLSDLTAGLAGADHQHFAGRQRLGIPIFAGMDLRDMRCQLVRHARHHRQVITADGDHHLIRAQRTLGRIEFEQPGIVAAQARHRGAFHHGRIETRDVLIDVFDDLVLFHETVRIAAGVVKPRQCALPVRRDQAEGVPTLAAPRVADTIFLYDQMVDALLFQVVAHRKAGLATADNQNGIVIFLAGIRCGSHGVPLQNTEWECDVQTGSTLLRATTKPVAPSSIGG